MTPIEGIGVGLLVLAGALFVIFMDWYIYH